MLERIRNITSAWLVALLFIGSIILYALAALGSKSLSPDSANVVTFGAMTTYAHDFIHKLIFSLINTSILNEALALFGLALFVVYIASSFTIIGALGNYLTIVLLGSIFYLHMFTGIACGSGMLLITLGGVSFIVSLKEDNEDSRPTMQLISAFLVIIGAIINLNIILIIVSLIIGALWGFLDVLFQNFADN